MNPDRILTGSEPFVFLLIIDDLIINGVSHMKKPSSEERGLSQSHAWTLKTYRTSWWTCSVCWVVLLRDPWPLASKCAAPVCSSQCANCIKDLLCQMLWRSFTKLGLIENRLRTSMHEHAELFDRQQHDLKDWIEEFPLKKKWWVRFNSFYLLSCFWFVKR